MADRVEARDIPHKVDKAGRLSVEAEVGKVEVSDRGWVGGMVDKVAVAGNRVADMVTGKDRVRKAVAVDIPFAVDTRDTSELSDIWAGAVQEAVDRVEGTWVVLVSSAEAEAAVGPESWEVLEVWAASVAEDTFGSIFLAVVASSVLSDTEWDRAADKVAEEGWDTWGSPVVDDSKVVPVGCTFPVEDRASYARRAVCRVLSFDRSNLVQILTGTLATRVASFYLSPSDWRSFERTSFVLALCSWSVRSITRPR